MIILDMPETLPETLETPAIDLEQMGIEAGIESTNGHATASGEGEVAGARNETPVEASKVIGVAIEDSVAKVDEHGKEYHEVKVAVNLGAQYDDDDYDPEEEREAEEHLCNCQLRIATLKRQLKFAKAELDEATETLEGIRQRGDRKYEAVNAPAVEAQAVTAPTDQPSATPADAPAADPIDWRTAPLSALGLKDATAKRLLEHDITTLGQLEDLRAKGNVKGFGLRSIKGIGDAKVTEIEDAVIAWFTKNPQAEKVEAVAANATPAPEAVAEPLEPPGLTSTTTPAGIAKHDPDAIGSDSSSDPPVTSPADYDIDSPESRNRIVARAKEINDGSKGCLDKKLKAVNYWEAGQQHCKDGHPLTECGVIPGPEQDDWLRGFMAEQLLEEFEPTE